MSKEYSEDELIEKNAIKEFISLGYSFLNCFDEKFGSNGTLGRETKSEVLLLPRLRAAIIRLNPNIPAEAVNKAIEALSEDRSRFSLVKANQEVYKLLKDGVKVKVLNKKGEQEPVTVKLIDFENSANNANNDFFLASQFWVTGDIYTKRADLVAFVNGIPLIFIELKAAHRKLKNAFDDNLTDYKDTIPHLFWYNAFVILSNGTESKIGTITSGFEHFNNWKKISEEKEKGVVSLDTILNGTCEKNRLLDLLENFILYTTVAGSSVKIVAKNHQFLGVNNAVESFKGMRENQGKLGVFWHTQGAGKSFSMIFFAQKVLRKYPGNYTFLIVTDREDLDKQIYENFQFAGVVTEEKVRAEDGKDLKKLLQEDHRMLFTLIQKFHTKKDEKYPKLSDRDDIIVMADEAHRTQYDAFAQNMSDALPKASFIGFTGTPLMVGEERTKDTFGDYVSVYNFQESVDDKATVRLLYDNRVPEVQLKNNELNEDIYEIVDAAELDEAQEDKLSREFSKEYQIITRDDRLEIVAEDIIDHFITREYGGKAMVVSIDRYTAVKMYDKVQKHRLKYIEKLEKQLNKAKPFEAEPIQKKIEELKKLDMAVVVSTGLNEVTKFKKKGLDITKHRKRIVTEDLEKLFKDSKSDFRMVFVCSMWMTGFDVPSLSTIYLDKPMKNHTLMQAIARANRVFGDDKIAGFIIDYIGIFRSLNKALAIYASGTGREDYPIQSKERLVEDLGRLIGKINGFLCGLKQDPEKILSAQGMEKIALIENSMEAILVNEETKKKFLSDAGLSLKLYKAITPHRKASDYKRYTALYEEIIRQIKSLDPEVDITGVLGDIQKVLDDSVESRRYVIKEEKINIDLSKIDFEKLKKEFARSKKNTELEKLKNVLSYKLRGMLLLNNTRINFQEKFQAILDDYNSGSSNAEEAYKNFIAFGKTLNVEEHRAISEGLSEEEQTLFDKLKKEDLTDKEKTQIKKVAKELLETLKAEKLVLDWRKKQQTRADVKLEIEMELDKGLPDPPYNKRLYEEKCQVVFQHVYDSYFGDHKSVFQEIQY